MRFFMMAAMCCLAFSVYASGEEKQVSARIINQQQGISGNKIWWQIELMFRETVEVKSGPDILLPDGWTNICYNSGSLYPYCYEGSVIALAGEISYPSGTDAFYPQDIRFEVEIQGKDDTIRSTVAAEGKIWFTPWNMIEIWNSGDFYKQDRVWLSSESKIQMKDTVIWSHTLPQSDIPDDFIPEEEWQDDYQLRKVEGLAFMIPMMPIHPDSIALYNNEDLPPGVEPDSLFGWEGPEPSSEPQIAGLIKLKRRFKGTVKGRLMSTITNDLGDAVTIPLAGVFVKLKEYDWYANEDFASAHTDENGYFTLSYDLNQSFAEGKTIDLFLKFKSKNMEYDIKVKEHAVFGGAQEESLWMGEYGQDILVDLANIHINSGYFRTLHWTYRAWKFAVHNGLSLERDLTVLPYRKETSFFFPNGLIETVPFTRPTIRLEAGEELHENTIYHEFGHFFMWMIQRKLYITTIANKPTLNHSLWQENSSKLAWWEGWANAYMGICDAFYFSEDSEYGFTEKSFPDPEVERRVTYGTINNGLWSEYYIQCAIYDLWDGPDKGLPGMIPGANNHGYNDRGITGSWSTEDNISLPFSEIARPLTQHILYDDLINHIGTYYERIIRNVAANDCQLRSDISRCFRENRVVFESKKQGQGFDSGLSSDDIKNLHTVRIDGYMPTGAISEYMDLVPVTYFDTYKLDMYRTGGVYLQTLDDNSYRFITDPVVIRPDGYSSEPGRLIIDYSGTQNALNLQTCGGPDLYFRQGILQLGQNKPVNLILNDGSLLTAHDNSGLILTQASSLTVNSGALAMLWSGDVSLGENSTIRIRSGGSLIIGHNAVCTFSPGSMIIVEPGGYICIREGAILEGSPLVELQPGAVTGTEPSWGYSFTDCMDLISNNPYSPVQALYFDGIDDYAQVPQDPDFEMGAGDFTIEAIFTSSNSIGTASDVHAIISKRSYASGSQADGYIFGIWTNGALFFQGMGTPNFIDNNIQYGYNLFDGNCHHVALTRSGNFIQMYVDGVPTYSFVNGRDFASPGPLRIGRNGPSGLFFHGEIAEIKFWNSARTANQISSGINSNAIEPGLLAFYDFDINGGQEFFDKTGNEFHGFLGSVSSSADINDPVWSENTDMNCEYGGNLKQSFAVSSASPEMSLVPNPAISSFRISGPYGSSSAKVELFSASGTKVLERYHYQQGEQIDISSLESGMYIVTILTDSESRTCKLLKAD